MNLKALFFLLAFTLSASAKDFKMSILSEGLSGKPSSIQNSAIRSVEEFKKAWAELGIGDSAPYYDFKDEVIVLIAPRLKAGSSPEISRILKNRDGSIEVRYSVSAPKPDAVVKNPKLFPYILARLYPIADVKNSRVKFIQELPRPPVPPNSGIGQIPPYTNVLKGYDDAALSEFLPLGKGNAWTYKIESKGKARLETYSVVSLSQDGWSVFDNFFGRKNIAMRVDPSGELYVSSAKNGERTFYTPDIQRSFRRYEFTTPAGKFGDLMIVTVPKSDKFWFKDIYARGVGLIYHEHQSPTGSAKYFLSEARVNGGSYPKARLK